MPIEAQISPEVSREVQKSLDKLKRIIDQISPSDKEKLEGIFDKRSSIYEDIDYRIIDDSGNCNILTFEVARCIILAAISAGGGILSSSVVSVSGGVKDAAYIISLFSGSASLCSLKNLCHAESEAYGVKGEMEESLINALDRTGYIGEVLKIIDNSDINKNDLVQSLKPLILLETLEEGVKEKRAEFLLNLLHNVSANNHREEASEVESQTMVRDGYSETPSNRINLVEGGASSVIVDNGRSYSPVTFLQG